MAVFKCKRCGGTLDVQEGMTVCECDYCGTKQTVPNLDDEKKINLFTRANRLRSLCEFDKAASVYEAIVSDFPEEAEAYWGLLLCKFGIEYVDDPGTGKKIPTCHRSSFDSLMDDPDFDLVMEYADPIARRVYREEAKQIEELRKGIIEVSSREEPYDIFICYKEADGDGQRTLDSVLAQDIYDMLTENGYRVFFSRISLEDKLGVEYEPYIFAALNSAKIMLAVGTDYDYYNAVWVKNEWSRFLQLIAKGEKKVLIPCYKNIDAYDMPKEFARLQAQDLGKVGAMQDLLRGISKILTKDTGNQHDVTPQTSNQTEPLLRRVFLLLEDKEWEKADDLCEQVLNQEPENAEAYLGKLMAQLRVCRQEDLRDCEQPFDNNNNYTRAVRFGGETLRTTLQEYVAFIKDRNETKRKTDIFNNAVSMMRAAKTEEAFQAAAKAFQSISGFRDADVLTKQCLEKSEDCRRAAERKARAVARALKEGGKEKANLTIEEKIAAAKTRIGYLERIQNVFNSTQTQIQALRDELNRMTSQEKQLTDQRSRLGLFAGKEKKRIDEELAGLSQKKSNLTSQISQFLKGLGGYVSVSDIERDLNDARNNAADLETQIESARENAGDEYSFEEALSIYLKESDVAAVVNNIFPAARFSPAMYGKTNIIRFGRYIQKKNGTLEPIEWQVLARKDGRMLVISKYALDCQKYNTLISRNVTWETCSLRKWLNEEFVNNAFNSNEQKMIISTKVTADKNPLYSTPPGNNTTDKVFLLSITEAARFFNSDSARQCQGTDYCYAHGAIIDGNCFWWLRSPGDDSDIAACVSFDGSVSSHGLFVRTDKIAVRPALWIDLES